MDIYWWLEKVIIPLVCVGIGFFTGYKVCKNKYVYRSKDKRIVKDISINGDGIVNSDGSEIKK